MQRLIASAAGLAVSMFALCAPAAAMPPIMDRVPTDASVTIVIPNMDAFAKSLSNLGTLVGAPVDFKPDMLLQQMGVPMGIVKDGAIAAVIPDMPKEGGEPQVILLVPTTDYKALVKGLGGEAAGGVDKVSANGQDMFAKSLDGNYAALSNSKDLVEKFTGKGGNAAAHKTFFGGLGDKLSDRSEFSVFVNFAKMRPAIKDGMKKQVDEMAQMMPEGEGPMGEGGKWIADLFANETSAVVLGAKIDSLGVSLDAVPKFVEGSKLEAATKLTGKSTALLNKLPARSYLAALAADFSNPAIKALMKDAPKPKAGKEAAAARQFMDEMENTTGQAMLIGASKGGIAGGLLGQMVQFTQSSDKAKSLAAFRKGVVDADTGNGEWTDAPAVNGLTVNQWSKKMPVSEEGGMGADELFGNPEGPVGYVAQTESGLITTFSKNTELLTATIKSVGGEGGLGTDKLIQQVGEKLPSGRMAEVYIGLDSILNSVPQAQMVVGMMGINVPASLPPIGLAVAPEGGSAQASIFVPTPVIKMIADVAKAAQGMGDPGAAPGGQRPKRDNDGGDKGDKF